MCEAAALLENGVALQGELGLGDWPASFVDSLQIVLHEQAGIREKIHERARRKAGG